MTASKINVAFLFLDHMHHVYHGAPTAFELSKDKRFNVVLFTALQCNLDIFYEISKYYPGHHAQFKKIDTTFWSSLGLKIIKRVHPTVRNVLKNNIQLLLTFDALVTPDDCLHYIMEKEKKLNLKYITTLHGPGDSHESSRYKKFDYILVSGKARWELMLKEKVLTPDKGKIIGYPKFDVTLIKQSKKRIFDNDNPTVIYNPHADPQISSYNIWGHQVIDFFYENSDYNLIFAPHIMIFAKKRIDIPEKYYNAPNIHIDYTTKALADMTYTKNADIYIGDLSSQIYEFLYNPRPCIFLNAHHVNWKDIKRYHRGSND